MRQSLQYFWIKNLKNNAFTAHSTVSSFYLFHAMLFKYEINSDPKTEFENIKKQKKNWFIKI